MQIIYKIYQKDVTGITDALSLAKKNAQWELVTIFQNSTKADAVKYVEFCLEIEALKAKFDYDGRSLKFKIEEEYMANIPCNLKNVNIKANGAQPCK